MPWQALSLGEQAPEDFGEDREEEQEGEGFAFFWGGPEGHGAVVARQSLRAKAGSERPSARARARTAW